MDAGANPIPPDALEDMAYLSRSSNRANILDLLTRGAHTRRELTEHVDASRPTLDRIVNELEDRGWIERTTDGDYVATSAGTHLIREIRPCVESVEAIRRLGPAIDWLPVDELDIGLRHFRDATVRWPAGDDPAETVDFMNQLMNESSNFQALTHLKPPASLLQVTHDAVMSGRLSVKAVGTDSYSDGPLIQQSDRRELWRDILEAGGQLYRYDGLIPCNVWIFDDLVLIKKSPPGPIDDSYGVPIVSENSAVRSWAEDLIDQYIADADRLDEDSFVESSVTPGES